MGAQDNSTATIPLTSNTEHNARFSFCIVSHTNSDFKKCKAKTLLQQVYLFGQKIFVVKFCCIDIVKKLDLKKYQKFKMN